MSPSTQASAAPADVSIDQIGAMTPGDFRRLPPNEAAALYVRYLQFRNPIINDDEAIRRYESWMRHFQEDKLRPLDPAASAPLRELLDFVDETIAFQRIGLIGEPFTEDELRIPHERWRRFLRRISELVNSGELPGHVAADHEVIKRAFARRGWPIGFIATGLSIWEELRNLRGQ